VSAEPSDDDTLSGALEKARSSPELLRELCRGLDEDDASRKPGVGKLSAREHVGHLIEMELDVFRRRFERTLNEDRPRLAPVTMEHEVEEDRFGGRSFDDLCRDWEEARAETVLLVDRAEPDDWERVAEQPEGGQITFLELVAQWAKHDDDHLRQLEIIALNSRERNL